MSLSKSSQQQIHKALTRRYLLWAYKTTRESFERLERKTTQLKVDELIGQHLKAAHRSGKNLPQGYDALMNDFNTYVSTKRVDEAKLKSSADYAFLSHRLQAIEIVVKKILGAKALREFHLAFEEEFTRRILETRDHH